MNSATSKQAHWLTQVIASAGLTAADAETLNASTPIEDAWREAARACGISEDELAMHVAAHFKLPVATLAAAEPRALRLIPERLARKRVIFPLRETNIEIAVATADPTDLGIENDVSFSSGRQPVMEIAPPRAIADCIASAFAPATPDHTQLLDEGDLQEAIQLVESAGPVEVDAREVDFAPVIKLTNLVLRSAIEERASDIHIEPAPNEGVVRFRVDGVLHNYMKMPLPAMNRVISRIKIMSKLDIADRLRPQDGRASISINGRAFDLRVSSVPTRIAEKVVIRILGQGGSSIKLRDIEIPEDQLTALRALLAHRNGIVAVTGPTGSGKTTTLYAALRELATGEENIMTVEDPVEYELGGITQIQVENKRGLTFAAALRSLLRQDPDIILIGEIRDSETSHIAVQASMTGHLVLATLHTNDAISAVQRLIDLGLDRASIASTLRGVIAQRLVRKVCPHCAQKIEGDVNAGERRLAAQYGIAPVVRAVGCAKCLKSGYMGRVPVMEMLTLNPILTAMIASGASMDQLQLAATGVGMRSLYDSALQRAARGETTLEEVERVVGVRSGGAQTDAARPSEAAPAFEAAPAVTGAAAPALVATAGHVPARLNPPASGAAEASAPPDGAAPAKLPRILLVDDEKVNRKVARTLLQKNGFEVVECEDGQESIDRLRSDPNFSLILLDLAMPRVDGREVLRWVRETPSTRPLPVVVFTASQGETLEAELMDEGADDYIRKPLDPPRFIARIKATIRRAAA